MRAALVIFFLTTIGVWIVGRIFLADTWSEIIPSGRSTAEGWLIASILCGFFAAVGAWALMRSNANKADP